MRVQRVLASAAAALATATGVVFGASPAQAAAAAPTVTATSLASTVALSNCSAALVRYATSADGDPAMMLTNGHCYEGGLLSAGQVLLNRSSTRSGTLLNSSGSTLGTVRADRVLYATMTGTDVTLYRLTSTFAALKSQFGATALTLSAVRPSGVVSIAIPSSFFKRIWTCQIDGLVGTLREGDWTWHDSIRYDPACNTIHGTSGSPVVDAVSGQIVGINNTGNDDGARCTLNNPCEVAPDGTTTVVKGQSYGQQTYWFNTCLTAGRTIDLTVSGCLLAKPAAVAAHRVPTR